MKKIIFSLAILSFYSCKDDSFPIADALKENEANRIAVEELIKAPLYFDTSLEYLSKDDVTVNTIFGETQLILTPESTRGQSITPFSKREIKDSLTHYYTEKWVELKPIVESEMPEFEKDARIKKIAIPANNAVDKYLKAPKNLTKALEYKLSHDGRTIYIKASENSSKTTENFLNVEKKGEQLILSMDSTDKDGNNPLFQYTTKENTHAQAKTLKYKMQSKTESSAQQEAVDFPSDGSSTVSSEIRYFDDKPESIGKKTSFLGFETAEIRGKNLIAKDGSVFQLEKLEGYNLLIFKSNNHEDEFTYLPFEISKGKDGEFLLTATLTNEKDANLPIFLMKDVEAPAEGSETAIEPAKKYAKRVVLNITLKMDLIEVPSN